MEGVLNTFFSMDQMLVREAFTLKGEDKEGIIEQIDGVIEIDNQSYLVEMKWKKEPIGGEDIFAHLGRIYHRTGAWGIYISATGFINSGIIAAKEALLKERILILTDLKEFVYILENKKNLSEYFKEKIKRAKIDKNPYSQP